MRRFQTTSEFSHGLGRFETLGSGRGQSMISMISTVREWLHRVDSGPSGLMSQRRGSADSGRSRGKTWSSAVSRLHEEQVGYAHLRFSCGPANDRSRRDERDVVLISIG